MLKKLLSKVKEQIKKMSGSKPEKKSKTGTEKTSGERKQGQKPRTQSSKPGYKKRTYSSSGSAPYDKETGRRRRPAKQGGGTAKPAADKTDDTAKSPESHKSTESSKSTESPRSRGPRKYDDSKGDSNRYPRQRRGRRPARKFEGERNTDDKPGRTPQDENEVKAEHGNWDVSSYVVEPAEGKKRFHDLNLPGEVLHAIADLNYQYCTPIQAEVLEKTLEGRDATGKAQTGTGKTAAFLITAITHLLKNKPEEKMEPGIPRVLIIAPTRELVIQIERDSRTLTKYTKLRTISVFGGMDYRKQRSRLSRGKVDILVATPGRLLDFMSKGGIKLGNVELLVLDEADRMLDMGFIPDVKKIVRATPPKAKRQTLFFSATINDNVARLAQSWTKDSIDVSIDPENVAVDTVEQKVFIVSSNEKYKLLHTILDEGKLQRVIIFANRRDETKLLEENLRKDGISCQLLSGDVDQRQRLRTLDEFKDGTFRVLVATDVASRGLHIEGVSHVINFTLPEDPEDYVHRIGRTGRAGSTGISISFASEDDSFNIPAIEKFIGRKLKCIYPEDDVQSITDVLPEIKAEAGADTNADADTAGGPKQPDAESKHKPSESGSEEDEGRKE